MGSVTSKSAGPSGRRATALAAILLAGLVAASGCGRRERIVLPVTLDERAGAAALRHPKDFSTHEAVVRGVATMLRRDLELPVPEQVTVYMYSSRAVFERGLVTDGRLAPVRAAELGEFAIGVGKRRQLLLHDEGGSPASRDWLRLIAHELTHVAQIELAGSEGQAEQWLAEGMAEWAAFAVLESLGLDTLAERRAVAHGQVRGYPALQPGSRLDLVTLGSQRGFTARHQRDGSLATYQLAFLMTDYLARRHGFDRLVVYFRGFASGRSRFENFYAVFGQSLPDFEAEILQRYGEVAR
ncbi:MAG TPA: hypothetical protein VNF03_07440 [Patescibacteria group bacterium]|jgi:hypothetical protein|nr:hypothetical protein [Patescibacteria group bacterium]